MQKSCTGLGCCTDMIECKHEQTLGLYLSNKINEKEKNIYQSNK